MSNFDYFFSLFLFTSNCYCMTKLCSVYNRDVNFFLNVNTGHADLDEQKKLSRPFDIDFVSFVKLICRIFNYKVAVEILSRFVPSQRPTVSQYLIQPLVKNNKYKYYFLKISTRLLNSFISAWLNKSYVVLEWFSLADTRVLNNSA